MALLVDYKKLIVWQKGVDLVVEVYKLTESFPRSELYGLTSQIRRSAVSIPSNIAEGRRRCSLGEYRHFLQIAFGSGGELETQIEICKRLPVIKDLGCRKVDLLLEEIMRMLNKMITNRMVER